MMSSKSHFVALLLIIFLIVNVQSTRIMDDSSDCVFKGPCQRRSDCYERCGLKPPSRAALCQPMGLQGRVCCCL
ncbi:unnamed protein product [Arabidopsis thaliana]|uniref:Putative defensin-like protein 270 n=2 Tax=Arabidopsis thaliana TaxID=3702 RepID=DF270_ARATH|nr:Defensin-like (DEFL) family protein [Arabidopsis thaliana]Q2V2Z3.1 RecName: Full=Putative defensin-like protein 270; Flags: Precursor [Arabidopsis thaliana]AED96134.1 Defensin-like (DEFL) family protein [Arabidopsis thaliana]CAA0409191.1 unnamed protein product [Arabidopsis thaliana]VYS70049.1 unnamed protein product [Arabidopsis thaliana]|eukprot:NP_001032058.1 Defensin-like (DEFL) family protein [Arabidopsis thaliana]